MYTVCILPFSWYLTSHSYLWKHWVSYLETILQQQYRPAAQQHRLQPELVPTSGMWSWQHLGNIHTFSLPVVLSDLQISKKSIKAKHLDSHIVYNKHYNRSNVALFWRRSELHKHNDRATRLGPGAAPLSARPGLHGLDRPQWGNLLAAASRTACPNPHSGWDKC